jgi:hypothetical protein
VFVNGRRVAGRRGPGRLSFAAKVPRGSAKVRVVVRRKPGKRRVLTRSYTDCVRS